MSRLFSTAFVSFLALPLAAVADPITVTTSSSGFMDPVPGAVFHLGMDLYDYRNGPLPYSLSISSTFEPEQFGLSEDGREYWTSDAELAMALQIGSQAYRYDGMLANTVKVRVLAGGGYEHEVGLIPLGTPRAVTFVSNTLNASAGSDSLFAPRSLTLGPGGGTTRIFTFLDDPDAPSISWEMHATAASMSLQVVSTVPELAPMYALLAGSGFFVLRSRRRGRQPGDLAKVNALDDKIMASLIDADNACKLPSRPRTSPTCTR